MHYDLVDLRILLALARAGSLSRAAEEVHLTVSALSVRLKRLEEEAGTLLFERPGKGLVQTPAALVLVNAARRVLEAAASLEEDFAPYARREAKPLRIFSNSTGLENFLCRLTGPFLAKHPETRIEFVARRSSAITEAVQTGEADLGLAGGAAAEDEARAAASGVRLFPYVDDRHVLISRKDHELLRGLQKKTISFAETLRYPYASLLESAPMTAAMRERALAIGCRYEPVVEVPSFTILVEVVRSGGLLAVAPYSAAADGMKDLAVTELSDAWAARPMAFLAPASRPMRPDAEAFLEFALSAEGARYLPGGMSLTGSQR